MTTTQPASTESIGGGAALFAAFALLVLGIVAACITVQDQARATAADITIAPCSMQHVPAYTRADVCVNAAGSIIRK